MDIGLRSILLLFALVGFGAAGASLAVAEYRRVAEGESDLGLAGVAAMLVLFGSLCTTVAAGLFGVPVLGGVTVWASYIVMASNMGLFEVEIDSLREEAFEEPRTRT